MTPSAWSWGGSCTSTPGSRGQLGFLRTCHDVTRGFTDQRAVSEGVKGQLGKRNAPTTLNAALLQTFFWDGRSPSLDHQARHADPQSGRDGDADEVTALKAIRDVPSIRKPSRRPTAGK